MFRGERQRWERRHHLTVDLNTNRVVDQFWKWHRVDDYYTVEWPDLSSYFVKDRFQQWGAFISFDDFDRDDGGDDCLNVDEKHWPKLWDSITLECQGLAS